MLSENELFFNSDDVFLIFRITISKLLKNFSFNKPLLVETLFVSKDFETRILL